MKGSTGKSFHKKILKVTYLLETINFLFCKPKILTILNIKFGKK